MRETIASVREEMTRAARDPQAMHFYARAVVTVTNDPEALYEKRKDTIALIHALPGMEHLLKTDGFDIERIVADVRKAMRTNEILERGGGFPDLREGGDMVAAKKLIPVDLMKELIVAGTPAQVRDRLREFEEIGLTHVFLSGLGPTDTLESLQATIKAIS
jgi:alkanesulfonate monooxygenase SsuD/methylene tetrahydromethanopterin reductase-like flavin-dependent oxidoreductase (luciferase family)